MIDKIDRSLKHIGQWYLPEKDVFRVSNCTIRLIGASTLLVALEPLRAAKGFFYIIRGSRYVLKGEMSEVAWGLFTVSRGVGPMAKGVINIYKWARPAPPVQGKKKRSKLFELFEKADHCWSYISKTKHILKLGDALSFEEVVSRSLMAVYGASWLWANFAIDRVEGFDKDSRSVRVAKRVGECAAALEVLFRRRDLILSA